MEFAYSLSQGLPVVQKFQIGEAMANAGVPIVIGGAGNAGPVLAATTTASDLVGVTLDTQATLVTAQQTDGSDPERQVSVIINPDAVFEALLSGGATENTALTQYDVTTASTTGLAITTGDDWTTPQFDEGMLWGYDGANPGIARKITSTSTTAATITVALPADTVVGDNFLRAPFWPGENQFVQLSTVFTQVDASVTIDADNNNFRVLEVRALDSSGEGNTKSSVMLSPFDHLFASGGSI